MLYFEWDPTKARANLEKHGVSFEEARTVFEDDLATQFDDHAHSLHEERFLLLGLSSLARLLIVCHCHRAETVVRIISARKATKNEATFYRGHFQ